jgi:pimeloyl-ACP methyl ester carboxylesterase
LDCGDTCNVTIKSKRAAGDKITLKAVPGFHSKLVQWSGDDCKPTTAPPSCTFKAKSEQSYRINAEFDQAPDEKVVLLLHGMNSSPSTWKDFVNKNFKACYTIDNGVVIGNTGKKFPVNCYAVTFGAYDAGGDPGLEDARRWANKHKLTTAGDFSTFDQLGKEVDKAVGAIKAYHPGAHIVLIGHSRGGLAARAFLANKTAAAPLTSLWTDYVDGLITTGTPHKGTPVGKIYAWLKAHPRDSCGLDDDCFWDWKAVDELAFLLRSVNSGLDARRPVIGYLASGSTQLAKLNSGTLPDNVAYGQLRYGGMRLGLLSKKYDIFPSGRNGGKDSLLAVHLTDPAIDFMLGNGVNANDSKFDGDGIVPLGNQGYGGEEVVDKPYLANKVLHTDEPKKAADINAMICKLSSPTLPSLSFKENWVKCP